LGLVGRERGARRGTTGRERRRLVDGAGKRVQSGLGGQRRRLAGRELRHRAGTRKGRALVCC
jgi:hypothetical protein